MTKNRRHSVGANGVSLHKRNLFKIPVFTGMTLLLMFFALFSSPAHACTNPAGTEGEIIFNESENVFQYCDNVNWVAMVGGISNYIPNSVSFDGASDYILTTGYGGMPDSKRVTGSFWIRTTDTASGVQVFEFEGSRFIIVKSGASGVIRLLARNAANTVILTMDVANNINDGQWHHVMFSFDLSSTSSRHAYVNDQIFALSPATYTDENIDFVNANALHLGATSIGGAGLWPFEIADFWLDVDTYIDLSVENNRRKFIDGARNPVFLGSNGQNVTGVVPDIFLSGNTASWHINKGSISSFNEVGDLTTGTPIPTKTQIVPSGLIGHWRLDETSGTTAFDSSGNGNDATYSNVSLPADSIKGVVGNALNIGIGFGRAQAPTAAQFVSTDEMTFSAWVYPIEFINFEGVLELDNIGKLMFEFGSNAILFRTEAFSVQQGVWRYGNAAPLNAWTHVAVTYSYNDPVGTPPIIYINGQQVSPVTPSSSPSGTYTVPASSTANIGYVTFSGDRIFNGAIDDARIYNRVLSADEIRQIYEARDGIRYNENYRTMEYFDGNQFMPMAAEFPDVPEGLIRHYKFEETSGSVVTDSMGNDDGLLSNGSFDNLSTEGAVGRALLFRDANPTTSYFGPNINSTGLAFSSADSFTFSGWLYSDLTNGSNQRLFRGNGYRFFANNNSFWFTPATGASVIANVTMDRTWRHVVFTYNSSDHTYNIFVDSVLEATQTDPSVGFTNLFENIGWHFDGFEGKLDDFRFYNRILTTAEIQTLYAMGAPVGSSTALPQGCPNIGDVCDDGTIYAGLSPDGNVEMYAAPLSTRTSLPWNNGNNSGQTLTSITDGNTGEANTNSLVVLDSDSGVAGFQHHQAIKYCYDLSANGADDWYLPSYFELNSALTASLAVDVATAGNYWSSAEESAADRAERLEIDAVGGFVSGFNFKDGNNFVLCTRKGPAPRCSNPYGLEGQMIYNTTHDVVQYCDGARWLAIGKVN